MVNHEVPTIEFNKTTHEIRINGVSAGYIDGSKSLAFEAVTDEHGLKVIVRETIELGSPLPDGKTSIDVILMILRPYAHIDKARRDREYAAARKAERDAAAADKVARFRARAVNMAVEFSDGMEGQTKIGGFF